MTFTALTSATAVLAALAGSVHASSSFARSDTSLPSGCLCTSDQSCWPSKDTFAALESKLSQPLLYPRPTAWACYPPDDPAGNCTEVTENWGNNSWRTTMVGSRVPATWESILLANNTWDACFLNTSVTGVCDQGLVPVISVDARSVEDIQTAVRFVVDHNLKMVVKNTGHDFVGRASAPNSFQLWTHHFKNLTYHDVFVPQGAPKDTEAIEGALAITSGVQWYEAYAEAHRHGRQMVGGVSTSGSVGAGAGWFMGGGHSFLSPTYGLGVDNVLEVSIVLSTGEHLVANKYQNPDLFWALRGGGGGTFGVVTSVTYHTHPQTPIQSFIFQANVTNSSVLPELVEGFLQHQQALMDSGWGGYGIITDGMTFGYYAPNMTNETAASTTAPWIDFVKSLTPYGVTYLTQTGYWETVYDLVYEFMFGPETSGEGGDYSIVSSRLISREAIAANATQLAKVLSVCDTEFNAVAGGRVSQIDPDAVAVNPAWRKAVVEMVCYASWNETSTAEEIHEQIQQLRGHMQELHDLSPNDGAYFNEASPFEIDWQHTFFGNHYDKLKSIKNKYDPHRIFAVKEGIASDDWNDELTCRY